MFVFSLNKVSYQNLSHKTSWRHTSNSRIGTLPAYQFLGRGDNTLTLSGSIMPGFKGSPKSLVELSNMADKGKAYPLISGNRRVWGQYVIEEIEETQTIFFKDGTPRKIEFTIELRQISTPKTLKNNTIKAVGAALTETLQSYGVDDVWVGAAQTAFGAANGESVDYGQTGGYANGL
ncbi:phage tail protein [Moraxella catarrhalis]|uniref:phage tail protein n=1 Tax=Moraxella TaxID=475 RepID=UPI001D0D63E4|nr:phage tail protein [Moraxella catarrhalis]